jgi:hypothetical protein
MKLVGEKMPPRLLKRGDMVWHKHYSALQGKVCGYVDTFSGYEMVAVTHITRGTRTYPKFIGTTELYLPDLWIKFGS